MAGSTALTAALKLALVPNLSPYATASTPAQALPAPVLALGFECGAYCHYYSEIILMEDVSEI